VIGRGRLTRLFLLKDDFFFFFIKKKIIFFIKNVGWGTVKRPPKIISCKYVMIYINVCFYMAFEVKKTLHLRVITYVNTGNIMMVDILCWNISANLILSGFCSSNQFFITNNIT
jgi:hypothetical protein